MKAYVIQSGHFSKAGNFIGISALGEKVHIYKKDITRLFPEVGIVYRCLGRYEKELIKFPFYCMADHLTFDNTDGTTFTRLTATEIHSSVDAIKAKLKLDSTIEYYERELKHYTFEASDRGRRLDTYREAYEKLAEEHDALVAKVERYDGSATRENEKLRDEIKSLQWNYDYAQSERERLELLCKEHENTIMNLQSDDMISKHVIHKINKLTQDYINKLIV
jgi:hypothetical protein